MFLQQVPKMFTLRSDNWIHIGKCFPENVFLSSFTTSSLELNEVEEGKASWFQNKIFNRKIKEATLGTYFIKVTISFSRLKIIVRSNEESLVNIKMEYVFRSSRSEVFCKRCVLRNFAKLTGKHRPQACNFIKRETLA